METFRFIPEYFATNTNSYRKIKSYTCGVNDSLWIKITIIIVLALISSLVFVQEAFGSVKISNFVSKNSTRIENFMS